eukprot:13388536-Alexandrium_andersonii.AAC.1
MSASLVGSEMCIRDRSRLAQRSRRRSDRLHRCRVKHRALRAQCVGPVSYTHLTLPTICSV